MEKEPKASDQGDEQEKTDEDQDEQAPPQDDTDSTFFDTDQHSDAPGPFGTG